MQEGGHHGLPVPRPTAHLRFASGHAGGAHSGIARTAGAQDLDHDSALFSPGTGAVTECG